MGVAQQPVRASTIEARPVSWLWQDRVPRGAITYLAGEPGLGKSLLSIDLVARLSRGELTGSPGSSILLTAEDSRESTILPRLEAAGADLERVYFAPSDTDGFEWLVRFPDDIDRLGELVSESDAALVVVDPLSAHLSSSINSWNDQSIRGALAPLHRLAEETETAVLLIGHLNKREGTNPLHRIGGSIGISAAARSALLLAQDPRDEQGLQGTRRVLCHIKSNVGTITSSLLFDVEAVELSSGEEPIETAHLSELRQSTHTAEELLRELTTGINKLEQATTFLQSALEDGPKPAAAIKNAAEESGITTTTLNRAKKQLSLQSTKLGLEKGWAWSLPPEGATDTPTPNEKATR